MANDKHLYELDELTTPQSNDLVMVEKSSNNKDMKVKMENFMPADTIASAVNTYLDGHSGYYVIPDGNVTMNKLATDVHQKFATKADIDGYYDEMSVGSAEQLLSNTYIPDTDPYLFRTTAGSKEVGNRVYEDAIVGGSVAWNQIYRTSTSSGGRGTFSLTPSNDRSTYTINGEVGDSPFYANHIWMPTTINGHVYYVDDGSTILSTDYYIYNDGGGILTANKNKNICKATADKNIYMRFAANATFDNLVVKPQLVDLTLMFGSTIADYIYTLEQSEAGSGIAWLKSYGFFTKDYYAYNAGGIQSVKTSAKKVVGFNQWDEEWEVGNIDTTNGIPVTGSTDRIRSKNYIPAVPDTIYFYRIPSGKGNMQIFYYGTDNSYLGYYNFNETHTFTTPSDCQYIKFNTGGNYGGTYNNDICISLHWDGERDGEYEAYTEHTYPLDSDLELRGIPKLDSSNKLYYDGDTYASDGTVTRRYGIVDLGTLNPYYHSTSGTFGFHISTPTNGNLVCSKYAFDTLHPIPMNLGDKQITTSNAIGEYYPVIIKDSAYTDAATFKTAMSGVYLVYELKTPTTETADPYTNPQIVSNWGTEEFVDDRTVPVPVGHDSRYLPDLRAKLESVPNNPSTNGKYFLQYENGQATYVPVPSEVPQTPSEDGTYVLKATVASGVATLAWVSEE